MTSVVDSCTAFKWFVTEVHSDKALRLRGDFIAGAVDLIAVDVFPAELAHAITRAERQKRITPAEGAVALAETLQLLPALFPSLPDLLPRAYDLSSHYRIGVYDCLYVALAERESCDLITADDKLVKTLGPHFPFIRPLASLP